MIFKKRILVVQTAFLGDCVLSLPFLRELLARSDDVWVDLVTSPAGEKLFEIALDRGLARYKDRVKIHRFDKRGRHSGVLGFFHFIRHLRAMGPSVPFAQAYCLQRSFRSGAMAWLLVSGERLGFTSGAASFFYTQLVPRTWDDSRSEIEKNLDLLRAGISQQIPAWDPSSAPSLLMDPVRPHPHHHRSSGVVSVSLGSPWASKRWPIENALELVRKLVADGLEVKLLGDASAKELGAYICSQEPSLLVKDFTGKTQVAQWIEEISLSQLVVSNDSAAVHIASDLGVPVLALFGPTLPEFGFAPWRRSGLALGLSDLPCRPCHIHGPKQCPLGHHKCLKDLDGQKVYRVVKERFSV